MLMKNKIKPFLILLICIGNLLCIQAQSQRQITGRVMDEAGELLIGVNVFEVGTSNGAVTDINGTYTIRLPPQIQFSDSPMWGFRSWR